MKNLLVPVDFSDALNFVVEKQLAQELPARIVLLHVDEPKAIAMEDAFVAAWPFGDS